MASAGSVNYRSYDVIVIGGGHAGCEAALASARIGARTLLLTMNLDHIAQMSCNPAIGGIGKGQVVREIDALGGEMANNTDATRIQFRMLNRSKGPAVWSPRAQCDKVLYQRRMKHVLERQPNLTIHQAETVSIIRRTDRVTGVITQFGDHFDAKAIVLCVGTFLRGRLFYGQREFEGGRSGDLPSNTLAECLFNDFKLKTQRLKTGTPPRLLAASIDFHELEEQESEPEGCFGHWPEARTAFPSIAPHDLPQRPCYVTQTNAKTRQLVLDNIQHAPMYNGTISGTPTRYCPSFEDKVMRFPHHEQHHIYLEPEGSFTEEYYLNGISTSLPVDIQWQLIRSLPGCGNAALSRYAYAIEYDFIHPYQLTPSLALQNWQNLFLAGQLNGTTGYEEAAGQGLIAGANAAIQAGNSRSDALVLRRDQAYIGVMIDDLVTKEIVEPYRLFTSRAEHRLLLRQDNSRRRLSRQAHDLGLLSNEKYASVEDEQKSLAKALEFLRQTRCAGESLWDKLRKGLLDLDTVSEVKCLPAEQKLALSTDAHYEGYVEQEQARAARLQKLDAWKIPPDFSYDLPGLRAEARQKLAERMPATLAQAIRLDGVTPAEIALLQVHLSRHQRSAAPNEN